MFLFLVWETQILPLDWGSLFLVILKDSLFLTVIVFSERSVFQNNLLSLNKLLAFPIFHKVIFTVTIKESYYYTIHDKWVPVTTDGASSGSIWRNGLRIWRVAANTLNKQ
jgi:hypothetical protein